MRPKQATSVAFFLMILLLGQAMTSHLNQIPTSSENSSFESTEPLFSSNNSTGNSSANDTDGDGLDDLDDDCPNGTSNWTSAYYTDHDSDGCQDSTEDSDDDNDGMLDAFDNCPRGDVGWSSSNSTDYDSDGCRDWGEDSDDDNDGVSDVDDSCWKGELGWTSSATSDADGDGCRDATEDTDGGGSNGGNNSANDSHCLIVDNFFINSTYFVGIDLVNICSKAIQYPGVNTSTDHSGVSGFPNQTNWYYMIGANGTYNLSWQLSFNQSVANGTSIQLDFEAHVLNCGPNNSWSHACPNSTFSHQFIFISSNTGGNNTIDTDGDGIVNSYDSCANGTSNWTSTNLTDHDADGCQDSTEDLDDDNDGTPDPSDACPIGSLGWTSTNTTDWDSDGCRDASEDVDDDNDGIIDSDDSCPKGATGWISSNSTDTNGNGCRDSDEEPHITIASATNSTYNQSSRWSFNYSITNYVGYISWNATAEDGTISSSWTSYVYSNGYPTLSQGEFYQSGNYTVCAAVSTQTNGSNGSTMNIVDSDCITISVYVAPVPVPCGNSSTLTFTNTSTGFNINDPITFSVIVQCGPGESEFILRGDVSKYYGSQSWNYNTVDYFQFNSNDLSTPYEVAFILNATNGSGDYIIQLYIGDAGNLIGYTQWNFTIYEDDDNDGVSDQVDNCANVNNPSQSDSDADGVGDACDGDIDGDGVENQDDAFPNNANETMDTDGDAVGDNTDTDDDGDGMADSADAFPLDSSEQADLDGDAVGDNLDADDDGDGITDVTDNCPIVSNADQADGDNDGVGTACDGMELSVDENGTITDGGTPIPSIGMVGTAVAISAGFFIAIRREDEE